MLFWKLVDYELCIFFSLAAKAVCAAFGLMKRLAALIHLDSFGCLYMYVCDKSLQLHVYLFIWFSQKSRKPTEMISNKPTHVWNQLWCSIS